MLIRLALVTAVLLAGCASSRPGTGSDEQTRLNELYGRWEFQAERTGERDITGWFVLAEDAADHRFVVPNTPLDSLVYESRPELDGERFTWEGELDSMFGRGTFRIDAVVDGDTMQGTNEVPRAGRYRFVAVRAK